MYDEETYNNTYCSSFLSINWAMFVILLLQEHFGENTWNNYTGCA